jgi:hypothetical protein
MLGLPITAPVIFCILFLITSAYVAAKFRAGSVTPIPAGPPPATDRPVAARWFRRWIFCGICVLTAMVILRTTLWPLSGWDTPFRWDFLAIRMIERHGFQFYPPVNPADFRLFFYTEPTPPMVSFSYWWLYATAGGHFPALTSILIALQFVWTIWFTYRIGRKLDSSKAGWLATGALAGSLLFVRSVAIGQENGLTALSMAAMLFAVVDAPVRAGWSSMILAGMAAALGAVSREYGCIFPMLGAIALIWIGGNWKNASVICVVAGILAGPWYVRNMLRTGNPFYPTRFGPFPVDKVHSAMFDFLAAHVGISTWTLNDWAQAILNLVHQAPIQSTLGLLATLIYIRKRGYLFLIASVVTMLWLFAIRYSEGGREYETRVLSPAVVILSVAAGMWMAQWKHSHLRTISMAVVGSTVLWSIVAAALLPYYVTRNTLEHWGDLVFLPRPVPQDWWLTLPAILPPHSRVLSANPYIHASLANSDLEIVPPWSPEVEFIADPNIAPATARQRLIGAGIMYLVSQPSLSGQFLSQRIPLFRDDMQNWKLIARYDDGSSVYELPQDSASTTSQP